MMTYSWIIISATFPAFQGSIAKGFTSHWVDVGITRVAFVRI